MAKTRSDAAWLRDVLTGFGRQIIQQSEPSAKHFMALLPFIYFQSVDI